ncbi:hypothetical protein [Embleya sp. MST-111070]|uniref:hypothetical protein n=1 Tax=Embleya sp. MST-111070 TaxID=3398231 RepID=UPI003F734755
MRRMVVGIPALVLSAALAGCGSGGSDAGSDPARRALPPVGAVPTITSVDEITRPIDRYLVTPEEVGSIQNAANIVNEKCMKEFGLPGIPTGLSGFDAKAMRFEKTHSPLYGFFDPAGAAVNGYDRVLGEADPGPRRAAPAAEVLAVEHGTDAAGAPVTSYAGRTVPPGGCKGESVRRTGGTLPMPDPPTLPDRGPHSAVDDPRVVAAYRAWSSCMKAAGYHYATPDDALTDPNLVPPTGGPDAGRHSAVEVAHATADVRCKTSTNLVGIAVAVQSAYDDLYIEGHRDALRDYHDRLTARLADARRIIAEAAGA